MAKFPMPVGSPKLTTNKNLNQIFGFVLAKIKSPRNLNHPILPIRDIN